MSLLRLINGVSAYRCRLGLLSATSCFLAAGLTAAPQNACAGETVLYSFGQHANDGWSPRAGLTYVEGNLFGTTQFGGTNKKKGTVFRLTLAGKETVLHSFNGADGSPRDGATPLAALLKIGPELYGTTVEGGAKEHGTVFKLHRNGKERVISNFPNRQYDGNTPYGALIVVNHLLYGTTFAGGGNDHVGTIFSLTPAGKEKRLYSFGAGSSGANPSAALLSIGDLLYGTTTAGGNGGGTVFSSTLDGSVTYLYSFSGSADGKTPESALIEVGGALYGTTYSGGAHNLGTVYQVTPQGAETVVWSFAGGSDGSSPVAGLLNVGDVLYGVTSTGGTTNNGTLFSVTPTGTETIIYSFAGDNDGSDPTGDLIDVNGTLYGTTQGGGSHGKGTVFAVTQ